MSLASFITTHATDDVSQLALQRNRYSDLSDADFTFALQQIDGKHRAKDKLSFTLQYDDWLYPRHLSLEQCSSETTARYKAEILKQSQCKHTSLCDLTGGYGIDTLFMSSLFSEVHYVEWQQELCQIAQHNFSLLNSHIQVHNADAGEFLRQMSPVDVIYVDPARRNSAGGKVFRMEDCEPNLPELLPLIKQKCSTLLVKLSPMLDVTVALHQLPEAVQVQVVALKGEMKEVLLLCQFNIASPNTSIPIVAVNLESGQPSLTFTPLQEQNAQSAMAEAIDTFLYEPNAAILKAGAFRYVAEHFHLQKLDANTHLYTSSELINDFPGRIFRVVAPADRKKLKGKKVNVLSRNHPLSANQLYTRFQLKEGGTEWLIATQLQHRSVLLLAEKLN